MKGASKLLHAKEGALHWSHTRVVFPLMDLVRERCSSGKRLTWTGFPPVEIRRRHDKARQVFVQSSERGNSQRERNNCRRTGTKNYVVTDWQRIGAISRQGLRIVLNDVGFPSAK